jgi:hypothetical protein
MYDPADDPAIVDAMSAGLVRRKQRCNRCPLLIIKPEFSCHAPKLPIVAESESCMSNFINVMIGFRPKGGAEVATVEEVADLAVYVASPLSPATTGAALRVDGGVVDTIA